jgi:hypothetical protein
MRRPACLAFFLFAAGLAGAQPAARDIHLIHMGGDDCPPCVQWRSAELPKLQRTPVFASIRFSYVRKPVRGSVPAAHLLPEEVRPLKPLLDAASGGNTGSPQTAIVVDGRVHDYYFGARSAADMEQMLLAIRERSAYPFPRCVRRGAGKACEDGG